jgi:hypothetical protein
MKSNTCIVKQVAEFMVSLGASLDGEQQRLLGAELDGPARGLGHGFAAARPARDGGLGPMRDIYAYLNWNLNTNVPDDTPGMLKVQKEPIHSALAVGVPSGELAAKRQKTRLSMEVVPSKPYVLPSLRSRTNLFGETSQPLRTITQAPLTIKNMTADQFPIISKNEK